MLRLHVLLLSAKICYSLIACKAPWRFESIPFDGKRLVMGRRIRVAFRQTAIYSSFDDDALERTKQQLEILTGAVTSSSYSENEENEEKETMYQEFVKRPANSLKEELNSLKLPSKGRKPDLARRLVDHYIADDESQHIKISRTDQIQTKDEKKKEHKTRIKSFASVALSKTASHILTDAGFTSPTSIQSIALPILIEKRQSIIIHSETGSGKTIAYLLPITEKMWKEKESNVEIEKSFALILTPTRELAVQVASIATSLSPPNTVRLITTPSNLMRSSYEEREKSEADFGGRTDSSTNNGNEFGTKLIVGSAKSIMASLFGDGKMPTSPTSKPEANTFLRNVQYLVLDEVDRLLDVKKSRGKSSKYFKKHEKPAALIASSVSRLSLGRVQVVAASATVGRPLRRELSRVLGLTPDECPQTIRGISHDSDSTRAISIPSTLKHYVIPCDADTKGGLLTSAAFVLKELAKYDEINQRILLVITNECGIQLRDAIGAFKHFGIAPEPKLLLDFMNTDGTDNLMKAYMGISELSSREKSDSFQGNILITGENSVRGIHLDDIDIVIIVGRPKGPDEYVHVAGRTGRAGREGKVVNVVNLKHFSSLTSLESVLSINFEPIDQSNIHDILE